ncbi:MAG: HEAT repeat domain-containing protein [Parachlamydiales bacterium]|jgi:HEAT repeat protein
MRSTSFKKLFAIITAILFCATGTIHAGNSLIDWQQVVDCHLILKDYQEACECIAEAIAEHPHDQGLRRTLILVYAECGLESEMLTSFRQYFTCYPNVQEDTALLEEIAWCILQNGLSNPAPVTRLASLVAAGSARDARAHAFITQGLSDTCGVVRSTACKVVGQIRAIEFAPVLAKLAVSDKSILTRLTALESLVSMKHPQAKALILAYSTRPETTREERHILARFLAVVDEDNPYKCFKQLAEGKDPALRALAVEYAVFTRLLESIPALFKLVDDPRWEVRAASLQALAVFWPQWEPNEEIIANIRTCSESHEGILAVSGAWVLALCKPQEGINKLNLLTIHPNQKVKVGAVSGLCAVGLKAVPYLRYLAYAEQTDPFIKLNAALGLLKLRTEVLPASRVVEKLLDGKIERMSQANFGFLSGVVAAKDASEGELPPELMDIAQRLEILQLLAILKVPSAYSMLESFLSSRTWGVSGMASLILLSEKNESAVELVEELLRKARFPQTRLQAALVLAMWGRSDAAVEPLHAAYAGAGKETKERILNALSEIGAIASIPFLMEAIQEPSSSMRIQAASALLKVVYK